VAPASGFGALSARQLAMAGHTVYAGIRETSGRNADRVADAIEFAQSNGVDLRARTSARGGTPPFLAPYFAAKAMDSLAVSYAAELIKFGIDTTIVVPGAFTHGTNHVASSGRPSDTNRATEYDELYGEIAKEIPARLAALEPVGADVADVARVIVDVVALPQGTRPFRVHIDPLNDGAEVVSAVADRMRVEFYRRAALTELLGTRPSL
jgi:NAD(P)-dependent dehydrogenase (short-subunit alcohol dehydrogenase family)